MNVISNLVEKRQKFLEARANVREAETLFVKCSDECQKAETEWIEAQKAFDENYEVKP